MQPLTLCTLAKTGGNSFDDLIISVDFDYLFYMWDRYVMESGEFRLGLGAEVDCRANATSTLCATFTLQTTPDYQPVCDAACDILTTGLCGVLLENGECLNTCLADQWTWDYVSCLEKIDMSGKTLHERFSTIY